MGKRYGKRLGAESLIGRKSCKPEIEWDVMACEAVPEAQLRRQVRSQVQYLFSAKGALSYQAWGVAPGF